MYERMISERDNIAATYKAEGDSEAKVIQNKTVILSSDFPIAQIFEGK